MEGKNHKVSTVALLKERGADWIREKILKWYACQYCKALPQCIAPKASTTLESSAPSIKEMGEEYGWTD